MKKTSRPPHLRRMNAETELVERWARERPDVARLVLWRALRFCHAARPAAIESEQLKYTDSELATAASIILDIDSPLADEDSVYADLLDAALMQVDWSLLVREFLNGRRLRRAQRPTARRAHSKHRAENA